MKTILSLMKACTLLLAMTAACTSIYAQAPAAPRVSCGQLVQYDHFASKYVEPRTIRVWLPADYRPDRKYGVLYMHDGQMLYDADFAWNHQEWGVDEALDSLIRQGKVAPCIVVGIDNSATHRIEEYASDDVANLLPEGTPLYIGLEPMGNRYLAFIVEELKPYIDSVYSTYRDAAHTYMMGSSCGGLITSYALCRYPDVFGSVACLSTHCTFRSFVSEPNPAATDAYIAYLRANLPDPKSHRLYMDCGDQTLDAAYVPIMPRIVEAIRRAGYDEDHFRYVFIPGAAHTETDWRSRLPQILMMICQPIS